MPKVISIYSPDWQQESGYGRKSLELTKHLQTDGYHVNQMGLETPGGVIKPIIGGLLLGYPTMLDKYDEMLSAGKVVAVTMFESSQFPLDWAENLNRCAAICVSSKFLVKVAHDSGVQYSIPIHVIPEGISDTFQYVKRLRYPKVFTFLAIADRGLRKNWWAAVTAFVKAFGSSDKHKLILKTRDGGLEGIKGFTNANIEILRADYSDDQLMELYARCHAMVFPAYGEGFGLPPREFAATGGAALCTQWGGLADDLPAWGYPLRYKLIPAWQGHPEFDGLGEWAEVDLDHLVKQMQYVASIQRWKLWAFGGKSESGLKIEPQSERVSTSVRRLYSWKESAEKLAAIWEKLHQAPVQDRRIRRKAKHARV